MREGYPQESFTLEAIKKMAYSLKEKQEQEEKFPKAAAAAALLRNYHALKESVDSGTEHSHFLLYETRVTWLMKSEESTETQRVGSFARQTGINQQLLDRLEKGLEKLHETHPASYSLLFCLYLSDPPLSSAQLMKIFHADKSTLKKQRLEAAQRLAVLLFGDSSKEELAETLTLIRKFEKRRMKNEKTADIF
jgi:hypothetical protein